MNLKIDDGTYYAVFAFMCCLVILYMAWDFRTAVDNTVEAVTIQKCNAMYSDRFLGQKVLDPRVREQIYNETVLPFNWT